MYGHSILQISLGNSTKLMFLQLITFLSREVDTRHPFISISWLFSEVSSMLPKSSMIWLCLILRKEDGQKFLRTTLWFKQCKRGSTSMVLTTQTTIQHKLLNLISILPMLLMEQHKNLLLGEVALKMNSLLFHKPSQVHQLLVSIQSH